MSRRGGDRGQASVEVLALVPTMVLVLLAAVAVMTLLAGASAAQDDARTRAMAATGDAGTVTVVTGTASVPVLPGLGWHMTAPAVRLGVRLP